METCMGTWLIFCTMPIAATALAPKAAVKLLSTVMPVTLSRFCMEAGTPTPKTPSAISFVQRYILGEMLT